MKQEERSQILGHFSIQGVNHAGAIDMNGADTTIDIFSEIYLHLSSDEMQCVHGVSKDGSRISAINCVPITVSGTSGYRDEIRHFMSLRPNYIAFGPTYLGPTENTITSISFTFTNSNNLFYDWGTFGCIRPRQRLSPEQKRAILRAVKGAPKSRRRGGHLEMYYRWDRGPIIEAACAVAHYHSMECYEHCLTFAQRN